MARLARPVWRAAIIPTFLPGGVLRPTVVGLPACLCRPPPCGCEAEIIFCPLTIGQYLPRVRINFHTVPAFRNGFSILPAPATTPTIALHWSFMYSDLPDGSRSSVPCGVWDTTRQYVPDDLARRPPSPG